MTLTAPPVTGLGNFRGSGVIGGMEYVEEKYGRPVMHAAIASLPPEMRGYVHPNRPRIGLLPSQLYPYAFIGQLMRALMAVIRPPDEDAFLRAVTTAGMDRTLTTVHRAALRFMMTPETHAARAQELWLLYHDAGRVTVLASKPNEYRVQVSHWPAHDTVVCRICMEARRAVLERMGAVDVSARRELCQGWGHEVCTHAFQWKGASG